jgi:hypothetical protein
MSSVGPGSQPLQRPLPRLIRTADCDLGISSQRAGRCPAPVRVVSHEPTHGETCNNATNDALRYITCGISQSLDTA